MAAPSEPDLKLLERALDQQATAGQAFFRDLKIAVVVLLVFQFGIFFRYVDLSDQGAGIQAKQARLHKEQDTVEAVQARFAALEQSLQSGAKKMSEELTQGRERLRARIASVNRAIALAQAKMTDSHLPMETLPAPNAAAPGIRNAPAPRPVAALPP